MSTRFRVVHIRKYKSLPPVLLTLGLFFKFFVYNFYATRIAVESVPLKPSTATTWYSEPLKNNGEVDFAAAANKYFSRGVSAENNFLVAIAPFFNLDADEEVKQTLYQLLGLQLPNVRSKSLIFKTPTEWLQSAHSELSPEEQEQILQNFANSEPWSEKQFPFVLEWLQSVEPILDEVVNAANRCTYCYHPIISPADNPEMLNIRVPFAIPVRDLVRALSKRAYLNVGRGDFDGWLSDNIAILKIRDLYMGRSHLLIQCLVATSLNVIGNRSVMTGIQSGKFSAKQLRLAKSKLAELSFDSDLSDAIRNGESLFAMDTIQRIANNQYSLGVLSRKNWFIDHLDWNLVSRKSNEMYDGIVNALALEKPNEQILELRRQQLELEDKTTKSKHWLKGLLNKRARFWVMRRVGFCRSVCAVDCNVLQTFERPS